MPGKGRRVLAVLLLVAGSVLAVLAFINPSLVIVLGSLAAIVAAIIATYRALLEGGEDDPRNKA